MSPIKHQRLNHSSEAPIPVGWGDCATLRPYGSVGALARQIRRLDDQSDAILLALLGGPARQEDLCGSVIVTSFLPLVMRRCRRNRERVDEFVGELAVVIGSVPMAVLRQSQRKTLPGRRWSIGSRMWRVRMMCPWGRR